LVMIKPILEIEDKVLQKEILWLLKKK
jgi:hypothetical protein